MSATDELRRLLDERGVEYDESDQGNTTYFGFDYCDRCGDYRYMIAITGACISAVSDYLTPEQAIAATLGEKPRDKTEEWLFKACNQATQDYVTALKKLVQDWQALYDEPDYGDCCRLRKRMQDLGIEVVNE